MGECHGCGRYLQKDISGGDLCAEKSVNLDEAGSLQREDGRSMKAVDEPPEGLDSLAQSTFQAEGRGSLLELGSFAIGKQPADLLSAAASVISTHTSKQHAFEQFLDILCTQYPFTALND